MKRRVAALARAAVDSRIILALVWAFGRLVARLLGLLRQRGAAEVHPIVVLATAGMGNIGDRAMLEAFLENVESKILVLLPSEGAIDLQQWSNSRVEVRAVPGLTSGKSAFRVRPIMRFVGAVHGAGAFCVVGADVMDGVYARRDSVMRSLCLVMAADLGVRTRVLGFSWSGAADGFVKWALREASRSALLLARDPASERRLVSDGMHNVKRAADMVFGAHGEVAYEPLEEWLSRCQGCSTAIVNMSGLIARRRDLESDYSALVQSLSMRGWRVVLLPHVLRRGDDDLSVLRSLRARLDLDRVWLVEDILSPSEVRWLTRQSDLVVTGRMHLGILGLVNARPTFVLDTSGKVEGLSELFSSPELRLPLDADIRSSVVDVLDGQAERSLAEFGEAVRMAVPEVQRLAALNFEGL